MMLAGDASEADFQAQVVSLARHYGWLVAHISPKKVGNRWLSDAVGFPDLVLAHPVKGVIFAELKTERGKLSFMQTEWAKALEGHAEYYCWRPSQLRLIANRLGASSWVSSLSE